MLHQRRVLGRLPPRRPRGVPALLLPTQVLRGEIQITDVGWLTLNRTNNNITFVSIELYLNENKLVGYITKNFKISYVPGCFSVWECGALASVIQANDLIHELFS